MLYILIALVILFIALGQYAYLKILDKNAVMKFRQENNIDKPLTKKQEELVEWIEKAGANLYINSSDKEHLKLHAKVMINENSNKWVVLVHGYSSSYKNATEQCEVFYKKGYNVLMPDLRGHGDSQGNYISMGIKDCIDLADWCNLIVTEHKDANIVLWGISMGASTVMNTIGLEKTPRNNIKCVIEDSGFTSAYEEVAYKLQKSKKIPKEPTLTLVNLYFTLKLGFGLNDFKPIEMIKNSKIPMIFIHGESDTYVPYYMLDLLYDSYQGTKERVSVKGATHGKARTILRDEYYSIIFDFIEKRTAVK